jgi:hypothetical protein
VKRLLVLCAVAAGTLGVTGRAAAYCWPVKPFHRMHAIRGAFDDPRFHLGSEGALSAFHFGVDIAARDGAPVYAVEAGWVTAHAADVTVTTRRGRGFGYWHIRPVVHSRQHVRLHQLLGYVRKGWGHVHFAESMGREYRNPLRRGALTPFRDRKPPVVASVSLITGAGTLANTGNVSGPISLVSEIYDVPPVPPKGTWRVARLTPAIIWWRLLRGDAPTNNWTLAVDFHFALMPASIYNWIYAPGTYQNKANRPGHYLFWVVHDLDTATLPNGRYTIQVLAADTRWNFGGGSVTFNVANAQSTPAESYVPGIVTPTRYPT